MADVEEIRVYLESHPEDHKQRWRLAKKLYSAWDYRSALEQLLLLREAWPDEVPVVRYLAATHYRLGKYEEAAALLVQAAAEHPEEVSLLEQLAKIHEGSGQIAKAAETWNRVLAIKPSTTAKEALARLEPALGGTMATMAGGTMQQISTHGNDTLRTCPHCGEGNDLFSAHCARCHGEMTAVAPRETPPQESPAPFPRGIGLVIALSALLAAAGAAALFYWLA